MTITVKEIMETMKSAEWVQNLENIRKMMDDMNSSSLAMQNTVRELKESGVLDEARMFMQSAKRQWTLLAAETVGRVPEPSRTSMRWWCLSGR